MPLLRKDTAYVSETTLFIRDLLAKNPEIAKGQIEGRALLWDRQLDRAALKAAADSNVPQKAYVYQPK